MTSVVSVISGGALDRSDIGPAAQLACLLEVSAPKPGNVSPGRHFDDTRYEHFLASAAAIGGAMGGGDASTVGRAVRSAIEATGRWTASNTNLGIVLLFAPLAAAAREELIADTHTAELSPLDRLRSAVRDVLAFTTVHDAAEVYAAIRRAAPGGLGRAQAQDVAEAPTITLLEAMRLAADRDGIAREYATVYETTFTLGVPALTRARHAGLAWDDAIVETFLTLLAASPDTHIARRAGVDAAGEVSRLAADVVAAGGVRTDEGRHAVAAMDARLRDTRNLSNPGTTADLTAAAIFVALLCGEFRAGAGSRS